MGTSVSQCQFPPCKKIMLFFSEHDPHGVIEKIYHSNIDDIPPAALLLIKVTAYFAILQIITKTMVVRN